jgi:hypothetical protein
MPLQKFNIFWLYALVITALGLYAWHLHAEKKRQMATYEQQFRRLIATHNHLEQSASHHLGQIQMYCDAYRMPESETLRMHGIYVDKAARSLSLFSWAELFQALEYDPSAQEMIPRAQRHILSAPTTAAFFQQEKDFADSLRLFSQNNETELAALEPLFSNERRAAAERIIAGNRPDQKVMFLALARVRHMVAANRSLAFLHRQIADGKSRFPQIMPIPVLEGTCHRAGETIRGEVIARSYSEMADNLTFFANEKPIRQELGLGKFSTLCRSAGLLRVPVQVDVQNPLTGEIKPYTQNTFIHVCE